MSSSPSIFPQCTPEYILSFQFSSWYPKFAHVSIKSTVSRPLSAEFRDYLDSDGVFIPNGSEDSPFESALSDDDEECGEEIDQDDHAERFAFPELDAKIREVIKDYGAVFPKLNFSSPKDAAWILPASSPLKCTSPADVYLLLKSSDFICHDLSREHVFAGCDLPSDNDQPPYDLELVLRKWYAIDRSREMRCFVREETLLGISQRDTNFYEFLNEPNTQDAIVAAITQFWETHVKFRTGNQDYTFDILLTRDLGRAHILDFNPYAPRTDPLLFSYDSLHSLLVHDNVSRPMLNVIDSRSHPAANKNAPAHQHNMVPFEAMTISSGKDIDEFAELWQEEIKKTLDTE